VRESSTVRIVLRIGDVPDIGGLVRSCGAQRTPARLRFEYLANIGLNS
jgi:hypothetical protein